MKNTSYTNNEQGVVAMIAVMFVAILLTIITLSMLRQTLNEERGAVDLMLSTKAFYAAEAGVQDALYDIKANGGVPVADESCNPDLLSDLENGGLVKYTCRLTLTETDSMTKVITPNEAWQIDLTGADMRKLEIMWHKQEAGVPLTSGSYGFGSTAPWSNPRNTPDPPTATSPPILRIEIIAIPDGGFTRDTIYRRVHFIRPAQSSSPNELNANIGFDTMDQIGNTSIKACPATTPSGEYVCKIRFGSNDPGEFKMDPNLNYILRFSTLYAKTNTSIEVVALNDSDVRVDQSAFDISIDVTAKANDVFRRIRYSLPRQETSNILPYTLLSNKRICKNPEVDNDGNFVYRGGQEACF